jgi:phage baseplate assembly protein W
VRELPDFGTSLRQSVFEPYTPSLKIKLREEIKATITKYEPRVDIIDLVLSWESRPQSAGLNHIYITLKFKVKGEITDTQILDIVV